MVEVKIDMVQEEFAFSFWHWKFVAWAHCFWPNTFLFLYLCKSNFNILIENTSAVSLLFSLSYFLYLLRFSPHSCSWGFHFILFLRFLLTHTLAHFSLHYNSCVILCNLKDCGLLCYGIRALLLKRFVARSGSWFLSFVKFTCYDSSILVFL